jgi:DNA-binding NarL/FixJ family response regulator
MTYLPAALAVFSLLMNLILITSARRQKRSWLETSERFDDEIESMSRDLDTASRQAGEHLRRIAWLEARVRSTQPQEPKPPVDTNPKLRVSITERRHRVVSLARRGQDVDTIAQILGMNHGEVELMLNLSKAA